LEYGSVCSDEIVSLAEETGLIVPISHWLLKTATEQVRSWQEAGFASLTLSVNLSGKQFKQFDFIETTLKILSENNFLPEFLELEITENLILQDPINTLKILQAIKKTGIRITIDDFGSGYSSLTYLKSVELDHIKIDKNLIQRITDEPATSIIISAIIGMANCLSIKTIAEGVETDLQYQFLVQEQCAEIQGYLVSPPLPMDLMQKFLRESIKKTLVIG
jgi:EAL domain-containing protein (putative c-di-GMP-specific phosphodiesterase class I)